MPPRLAADIRQEMEAAGLKTRLPSNVLVAKEAADRGIKISGTGRGATVELRHRGVAHYWRGGRNSLNTALAKKCTDNKEIASRLLLSSGVHAPESTVFNERDVRRAWEWAAPILPVVVKPNNGMQGTNVFVNLDNWEDFSYAFASVASQKGEVLVERFHPGQDHRVFVVDGKVVAVTRRIAAHVTGDGESPISVLVELKNTTRPAIHKKLTMNDVASRHLARQGYIWSSVPDEGEVVYLRGTANLHTGGDAMDATDLVTAEQIAYVDQAAKAIPGLRVAGFDLLVPDDGQSTVLEINDNPMIALHHFPAIGEPRNAARAVVNAMFPDTARPVRMPVNAH